MQSSWIEAEAWRKAGEWARAGAYFHSQLEDRPTADAAWRYAYCLRKAGHSLAGLAVARRGASRWPQDQGVRWELIWCLYGARLQPATRAEGEEEQVLELAHEMVRLGAEGLARQLAVFAAMGAARRLRRWDLVLEWCGLLKPEDLSARSQEGLKLMAPLERWHLARVKALASLSRWAECAEAARVARESYPHSPDFLRWLAGAVANQGDREGAAALLQEHLGSRRKQWYVVADLAKLRLELGDAETCRTLAGEAVLMAGEERGKVNLFLLMAQVHLALGNVEIAGNWLGWCLQVRADNGWPLRAQHQELLGTVERTGGSLSGKTALHWRRLCLESLTSGEERRRGRVDGYDETRTFCFIRDGEDRCFVLARDLPSDCRKNGAKVEFTAVQGFDRKKGCPALQARDVKRG